MDAEYYTPDVEDIHIGFECEINYPKGWIPIKVEDLYTDSDGYGNAYEVEHTIKNSPQDIRVSYLKSAQIEKEGWVLYDPINVVYRKGNFCLIHKSDKHEIEIADTDSSYGMQVKYDGSCKSINEFRVIIKLLKI